MKGMKMNNDKSNEGQENGAADRGQSAARLKRFYGAPGGPLLGWRLEEAGNKGMDLTALATELRVTVG